MPRNLGLCKKNLSHKIQRNLRIKRRISPLPKRKNRKTLKILKSNLWKRRNPSPNLSLSP
jgi:hypothetical protein